MRKSRRIYRLAVIVAAPECPIASVPAAGIMETGPFMQRKIRVGVDVMGGDSPPEQLLQAAEHLARSHSPSVEIIAISTSPYASKTPLTFRSASSIIEMNESPLLAIRRKRDSSLCLGIKLLKDQEIDAFVSAGNTGALVSYAKMTLGMLPRLLRPALLALIPTRERPLAVLDVGASVENKATHLVQFALIGSAYQKAKGISHPSVGLLNIGREAIKGTSELRLAYAELERLSRLPHPFFRFIGNIEGKAVFDGDIDVLITDGFTGNVFLKTAEGIASLILDRLHDHLPAPIFETMNNHLQDLQRHLHYAEYPGALLCGVRGIVIKCHGYSSPQAFASGIREAIRIASEGFLEILQHKLLHSHP